jgi:hypothetical protein
VGSAARQKPLRKLTITAGGIALNGCVPGLEHDHLLTSLLGRVQRASAASHTSEFGGKDAQEISCKRVQRNSFPLLRKCLILLGAAIPEVDPVV